MSNKNTNKEAMKKVKAIDEETFVINKELYKTPDMGDYYINSIDTTYIDKVSELVGDKDTDNFKASFYIENPPITILGTHDKEQVYFIKAKPDMSKEAEEINKYDGDTLYFPIESIEAGDNGETKNAIFSAVKDNHQKQLKDIINGEVDLRKTVNLEFGLRFLGINAPEIPHYYFDYVDIDELKSKYEIITKKFSEIKDRKGYLYYDNGINNDDKITFIKTGKMFSQFEEIGTSNNGKTKIKVLSSNESKKSSIDAGFKAKQLLEELISKANGEVYLMLDRNSLNRASESYPAKYGSNPFDLGLINDIKTIREQLEGDYNQYRYAGFNIWGTDAHGRFLGTPYVKVNYDGIGSVWINVTKYLIANIKEITVFPDYTGAPIYNDSYNFAANIFKLETYDYNNRVMSDVSEELFSYYDDRDKIQSKLFGKNKDELRDWTVTIGDCTFIVPPTSIRVVTQTESERIPVVRAKGSIAKGAIKSERTIEMPLYFNEEDGINGIPYNTKLPNGKDEVTYYMNGLRAIIAQFKFTPFLPIENNHINHVLGIEAVSLVNLQISTNPDYPKCISAILTLAEFDYRQYMPELPVSYSSIENYYNPFSSVINFQTMRWYYQSCIIRGQELKDINVNSKEYIEKTYGNKTALIPAKFKAPYVNFYLASLEHLDKMLQVKMEAMKKPDKTIILSDVEKQVTKDIAIIYAHLKNIISSQSFSDLLQTINDGNYSKGEIRASALLNAVQLYIYDTIEDKVVLNHKEVKSNIDKLSDYLKKEIIKVNDSIVDEDKDGNKKNRLLIYDLEPIFESKIKFANENKYDQGKVNQGEIESLIGLKVKLKMDYLTNRNSIDNLRREASLETQLLYEDVFPSNELIIPIKASFSQKSFNEYVAVNNIDKFRLDINEPDIMFMSYCADVANTLGIARPANDQVAGMKAAVDMDNIDSILYEPYNLDNIRVKNISASFGNNYNKIGTNGTDGFASQYMGGQDTIIEVTIETTSKEDIMLINSLPRLSSKIAREYRLVLPSSPLKIDCEITKLLGVNEVLIESLDVQTIPNNPGTYVAIARFISVDRTLRNREALQQIEIENPFSGSLGDDNRADAASQNYFEIDKALSKAEIYPDLELPTIAELESKGFQFVRHLFDSNRTYPDPDFYFIYGHVLTSEIFRETVDKMNEAALDEYEWEDSIGGKLKTKSSKETGVEIFDVNDIAKQNKQMHDDSEKFLLEENKIITKSRHSAINALNASDIINSWDICQDIKIIFMEKNYQELLKKDDGSADWLVDATTNTRLASTKIMELLNTEPNKLKTGYKKWFNNDVNKAVEASSYADAVRAKDICYNMVEDYLNRDEVKEIFELLNIKDYSNFVKVSKDIVWSAACAATSDEEYKKTKKRMDWNYSWYPNMDFKGLVISSGQDTNGLVASKDVNEIISNGIELGIFRIKMYSKEELSKIIGSEVTNNNLSGNSVNENYLFLDPYFRGPSSSIKDIELYKERLATDVQFSTEAFLRLALFAIKKMIDEDIFPNITLDILNDSFKKELSELSGITKKNGEIDGEEAKDIKKYYDFVKDGGKAIDTGKMFAGVILALTSFNKNIYESIINSNYEALNSMIKSSVSHEGKIDIYDNTSVYIRKMLLSLVGMGRIKKDIQIGDKIKNPVADFRQSINEKKYIEFAEDPAMYIKHSFYDMVVNDKRGRMARAFPTFYITLVDEGRKIGMWKLNDNFYNINSVAEIQIIKSRKIAADTARISMSNFFHTFTSDDEDANPNYRYDWRDAWNSLFNPRSYFSKEQTKRMKQQPINRAKINPGTRIHIRMGYGANAANLPIVFNGVIAEVGAGETVDMIAQGDGIELVNPILDNSDADEMKNKDSFPLTRFFKNLNESGATPKEILDTLLITKGGWMRKVTREMTNGYFNSEHPFGIVHFGDPMFNILFKNGEPTQNIFEAIGQPKWGDMGMAKEYSMTEAPKISTEIFGKSFWDILHICCSVSPDYIVGIAPFGMRSTIFHGHPRYYYAYEYYKDLDGTIMEKRKPYQQYHVYTSYSDIIKNDIKATSFDMKTNAVGLYKRRGALGKSSQQQVGPLWVDWNIYPEEQKSMTVDTQLYAKGIAPSIPFAGLINSFIVDGAADDEGEIQSGRKLAWRMTVSALRDSVKDMYQGELIVIGDPTVKPHDRMFLHDIYENMNGAALVEGCVHNFSVATGFTTTIYPDCIAVHDDRHELANQSAAHNVAAKGAVMSFATIAISKFMGGEGTPLWTLTKDRAKVISSWISKSETLAGWTKSATGFASKHLGAMVSKSSLASKMVAATGITIAGTPVLATGIAMTIASAITITTTKTVYNNVERWVASKQVLQIFPLKKAGRVMTAGLNGSMGLVYGSPTYNDPGTFKALYSSLLSKKGKGPIASLAIDLIASDEMIDIADRFNRNNMQMSEKSAVGNELLTASILEGVAYGQSRKMTGYKKHMLLSRINIEKEDELGFIFEKYAILDTEAIEIQYRITKENVYIKNDEFIRNKIDEGTFQLIHEINGSDTSEFEPKEFNVAGEKILVKALVENVIIKNEKDGTSEEIKTYNIPFLKPDAIDILKAVLEKTSMALETDEPEKDDGSNNFILLNSALVIGDANSMDSTGYSFSLQCVSADGSKKKVLEDAINELKNEIAAMHAKYNTKAEKLFEYEMDGDDTFKIFVIPSAVLI